MTKTLKRSQDGVTVDHPRDPPACVPKSESIGQLRSGKFTVLQDRDPLNESRGNRLAAHFTPQRPPL